MGQLPAAALIVCALLCGCGTTRSGRGWGEDVTLLPSLQRLGAAAVAAAKDPYTWAPAAGAAVFATGRLDENTSRWASEHTPVFGSRKAASDASDVVCGAAGLTALATALATPSGENSGERAWPKAKGAGAEAVAVGAALATAEVLKSLSDRERPDDSDRESFPSAHSTAAFAFASVGRRNLDAIEPGGGLRTALDVGFASLGVATAWARVEAKRHYPSDVLAGAAVGNFVTAFLCDAFFGLNATSAVRFGVTPEPNGAVFEVTGRFH